MRVAGLRAFLSNHAIQSCLDQYERTWRKAKLWGVVKNPGIIIISLNLYFLHVSNRLSGSTVIKCRSQWQQLGKKLWIFDVLHRPDLWRMQNHCSGTVELLMFAYAEKASKCFEISAHKLIRSFYLFQLRRTQGGFLPFTRRSRWTPILCSASKSKKHIEIAEMLSFQGLQGNNHHRDCA